MAKSYRFMVLDVFTDTPLAGNQLAVFTNAVGMSDEQMQRLAREINFSETAFVLPSQANADLRLRIFTPAREVPFAGHPTLGAAFAVAGPLQSSLVRIETGSGIVPVILEREGAKLVFGWMQQPVPKIEPFPEAEKLLAALRVERSELPIEVYDNGFRHVYVCLPTDEDVAATHPDLERLEAVLGDVGANVFAAGDGRAKTRMFCSDLGMVEDAATGSAAGPLAVHLARHGRIEWGELLTISQGEEIGRPSTLYARAEGGADGVTSVEVGGSAVAVARGEFLI
jgi:trans-2,3-dihydro-3-hydroxyanthranilate isomerase